MINKQQTIKLSRYGGLFEEVLVEDSLLKRFHDEIDFSFVLEELADKYSSGLGRYAINPVVLLKALILKEITELSDRDLVHQIRVNLEYRYFLDMTPDEEPFEASTLSYFRRQRLKDCDLMKMLIAKTLEIAVEKGVLACGKNGKIKMTVALDSTHTLSKGVILQPMQGIRIISRKFIKSLEDGYDVSLANLPEWRIPDFKSTEEAVSFAEQLLALALREFPDCTVNGKSRQRFNRLVEALEDIADHASCSESDRDAQVGHKTAFTKFSGYKNHCAIDADSGLFVDCEVTPGSASDTTCGEQLTDKLLASEQVEIDSLLGDGAYGSSAMIDKANDNNFDLVATPNHMLGSSEANYKAKGFSYNKDADMLVCRAGHMAIKKHVKHVKKDNSTVHQFCFDVEKCKCCKFREGCYKPGAKTKTCSVTICTESQKAYLKKSKTAEFKRKFKKRTIIERAFGQLKQKIGLRQAKYYGIEMMTMQTAVALTVYNLKLILRKSMPKNRG